MLSSHTQFGGASIKHRDCCLQVEAAHLCFVVGGMPMQPWDAAAPFCVIGQDSRHRPRQLLDLLALQRTEVLEWARSQGEALQ